MSRHLNEEQIAAAVAGFDLEPDITEHLRGCVSCRAAVEQMERLLEARRAIQTEEQPDWLAQRESILGALGIDRRRNRAIHWLAVAAAVVVAAGIGVVVQRDEGAPQPTAVPVEQVLAEVDQTLNSESIPGFEALDPLVPGPRDLEGLNTNGTS